MTDWEKEYQKIIDQMRWNDQSVNPVINPFEDPYARSAEGSSSFDYESLVKNQWDMLWNIKKGKWELHERSIPVKKKRIWVQEID